ncbi:MAG TPA: protein kinase [Polyangiales bacterium]|nr:protein kinase [Polyangiales bacterium]
MNARSSMTLDDQSRQEGPEAGRYQIERKLGTGGAATVYLVRDRETGERLALKRLHRVDERSGARLKREFRALANINHRNVIKLYDLGHTGDEWFLTMEYLEGQELLAYLDPGVRSTIRIRGTDSDSDADGQHIPRVAVAFEQLASGVRALHRVGVLHRDLKPSNVLVANGRVVVVDFGLATEVGDQAVTVTMDGNVSGTPAYMAPEQVVGRDWGEPNDWYAFGVMLYEALSGFLPIEGRLHELLRRKLEIDPTPLDQVIHGIPAALSDLCKRLLDRRPTHRPAGEEVLAVLRGFVPVVAGRPASDVPEGRRRRASEPPIFGRDVERERLYDDLARVASGGSVVVQVAGPAGIGKSRLVDRFLKELEQQVPPAGQLGPMILRSRCYERETVPFKALDAAVDAIVSQLSREQEVAVSYALPRNVRALAQLFPALCRLKAVQRLLAQEPPRGTTRQARDEAEAALRDLLTRLGLRRAVVLWIDDLHWGDLDSAQILKQWMEPPGIPGLMLILSHRSDEVATSPCLRALFGQGAPPARDVLALGPLADEHIRALCQDRLAGTDRPKELLIEVAEHIVLEAQGSPFLASQLSDLAASQLSGQIELLDSLNLERLVARRMALLSEPARRLLHVLAAAGRPVPVRLALTLADAAHASRAALHELSALGLTRTREAEGVRLIEVYHNRLREAVLGSLAPEARAELDRKLLRALEIEPTPDVAWLHALALGAGESDAALRYGVAAADAASVALAFEHAAEIYSTCLRLSPETASDRCTLLQKFAQAHAQAGRGLTAAEAYVEAARRSDGLAAVELERQAASHYLRSGYFEQGEALVQKVLAAVEIDTPTSTSGLMAGIAWERTRLAVRGLRFTPRGLDEVSHAARFAGELCGTLSIETQIYDPLRAAFFQARSLRLALDTGAPELVARALCVAATMAASTSGAAGVARADELLDRAQAIAGSLDSTLVHGNICSARAICAFLDGRMAEVIQHSAEAERRFRELSTSDEGEYYHRFMVLTARITALYHLGHFAQAHSELDSAWAEARAAQNIIALLNLSTLRTRFEIAADRAQAAVPRLESERQLLPRRGFGLLHAYHLSSLMRVACVTGDTEWALHLMGDDWARFRASVVRRGRNFVVVFPALHARFLLNHCVVQQASAALAAKAVAEDLRTLMRSRSKAAEATALRTRARLEYLAGERDSARDKLHASSALFEALDAREEAARDRYAYGVLLGGQQGEQLQAAALEALRGFGFVNAGRDVASYYPELFKS